VISHINLTLNKEIFGSTFCGQKFLMLKQMVCIVLYTVTCCWTLIW